MFLLSRLNIDLRLSIQCCLLVIGMVANVCGTANTHGQEASVATPGNAVVTAVPAVAGSSIKSGQIDIGVRKHL